MHRRFPRLIALIAGVLLMTFAQAHAAEVTVQGSVTVTPGFNLLGLPVDPAAVADTRALLPFLGSATQFDRLLGLDTATGRFEAVAYDQLGNVIGTGVPVRVGEAWIVYAKLPVTLNYNVTITCPQYVLDAGTHLLSFPFVGDQMTAYGLLQALGGLGVVSSIQGFDPATGKFETAAYQDGTPAGPDFPISPALGYFVMLQSATTFDPVPVLTTLTPNPVTAGSGTFPLTLSGAHFVPASTVTAGSTILSPLFINPTQLTATVPGAVVATPGSVPVTVTSGPPGCGTSNAVSLLVQATGGPPEIIDFSPARGPIGTAVTIEGLNFDAVASNNQVAFNGTPAIISSATTTSITTTVPMGATTGPITVTTPAGTATSADPFDVTLRLTFALSAVPAQASTLQGGQTSFSLSVTGSDEFTSLVSLAVNGLPSGVTAQFAAPTLAAGQTTTLSLAIDASVPIGTIPLAVTGTGLIDTGPQTQSVPLTLQVLAGGRTAIASQFVTVDGVPLEGVQVRLGAAQTSTDAGGHFLLVDVPAGTQQLMIDVNSAHPGFPIYARDVTLLADETNMVPPFVITPPPPPERFTPIDNVTEDQVITDPRFPGAEITLPQGVTIIGWDGVPKSRIAIDRLNSDQLPMSPPPVPTQSLYRFHFGTPMGGLPSAPLPVTLPNDLNLDPGAKAELWYYDATPIGGPAAWRLAGQATVSADGATIVSDPGVGITRFCGVCGVSCMTPVQDAQPNNNPNSPREADPVNLAMGQFLPVQTDLALTARLPITLTRTYNPFDPFGRIAGFQLGLGPGWALSVDVVLLEQSPTLFRLILPGNSRFDFVQQVDGRFVNPTHPRFAGAVLTTETGGIHRLRFKDGAVWRFAEGWTVAGQVIPGLSLLVEQSDRSGNRILVERDASGGLSRITDAADRSFAVTLNGAGRLAQIRDPIGQTVTYTYYSDDRLATVTDQAGGVTRYTYDGDGRILTITDPKGTVFIRNEYSLGTGHLLRQVQADGGNWLFRYQLQGSTVTGPGCPGPVCPVEESTERVAEGYTFSRGSIMVTQVIDPRGHVTTYRFTPDLFGREITDPFGQTTRFERDNRGRLVSTTDPLGRVTRFSYDAVGNVTSVTDPAQHVRAYTYEPVFNRATSITDSLGNRTTYEYDATGNLTAITDPEQNLRPEAERAKSRFAYNQFGQPISGTDRLGNTTTLAYNDQGDVATITDPLGNTINRSYDAKSRLISRTNAEGGIARFSYSPLDRLLTQTDPVGGTIAFTYDANANLLSVTDAKGNTTDYEYDSMDRMIRRIDPLGAAETFGFDTAGNRIVMVDRKGQRTAYSYDARNRLVRSEFADGPVDTFVYDAVGRLVKADDTADPQRPITRVYDILNQLVAETTAASTINYQYDARRRRTQMIVSGEAPVQYIYDANSRLRTIVRSPLDPVTIQYDARDRRTQLTLPNGVSTEYLYDNASRLIALIYRNPLGPLGDLSYRYDRSGKVVGMGGSFARTLLPDPVTSSSYDAANRQQTFGAREMTFDANGNLTSVVDSAGTTTFGWDARNRLARMNGPGLAATFAYDALNRRVAKTVNGRAVSVVLDGYDVVKESIAPGTPTSYLRSLAVDEAFVRSGGPSAISVLLNDRLGSTVALLDQSGGVATEYSYQPFGVPGLSGALDDNEVLFTGREHDGATELYYYRARYYAPRLHRFLSEDPIGFAGGDPNLYAYVGNSPTNRRDPRGLDKPGVPPPPAPPPPAPPGPAPAPAPEPPAPDPSPDDLPPLPGPPPPPPPPTPPPQPLAPQVTDPNFVTPAPTEGAFGIVEGFIESSPVTLGIPNYSGVEGGPPAVGVGIGISF